MKLRLSAVVAIASAVATTSHPAPAEPAGASPRVLTALDDTRACVPLAAGGWAVATGGGLALVARDGTARSLTSLDGLPDTRVHAVVESADGLWVGTDGGAALVAMPGGNVVRTVAQGSTAVHAVHVSASGPIFLGTWGGGVARLADKTAAPALVATSGEGKHVSAIAEHGGVVHVAYADGPVTRLDGATLAPITDSPSHGQALAAIGDQLWLGDVEGAYRIDGGHVRAIASIDARALAPAPSGALIGTFGGGLVSSRGTSVALHPEAGVPRWIRGVGARGSARCAATTDGLFVDEGAGWRRVPLGSLPSNDVTALAVNGDRVAIGTFDRGAAIFDGTRAVPIAGLEPEETVNAAAWQGEGTAARLWLATARGLVKVDGAGKVLGRLRAGGPEGLPSSIVRSVLVVSVSPSLILAGTEEGAAFVEGDRVRPIAPLREKGTKASLASPMHATWALARGASGTIYLGTSTGLYYGNAKDGVYTRASVSSGELADDWVTALALRDDGGVSELFVGTYSKGVSRLTFGSAKKPTATQLGGGYVNPDGLTLRGTTLVASTMDGLAVHPLANAAAPWDLKPRASTGRDVTAARVAGGELWVASRRGIERTSLATLGL